MGRKKGFNQQIVIEKMSAAFVRYGFEGTSLDDLVTATGLLRGSLYSAFGSKQGMFIACLEAQLINSADDPMTWRLVLVAMLELTTTSQAVNDIVTKWYQQQDGQDVALQLGKHLIDNSGILSQEDNDGK